MHQGLCSTLDRGHYHKGCPGEGAGQLKPTRPPPHQKITSQRLLDQVNTGPYIGENATYPPFWAFLGLFAYPTPMG